MPATLWLSYKTFSLREKSLFLELKNKSKWRVNNFFWKIKFRSTLSGGIFMNILSDFSLQKSEISLQEI